MHWKLKCVKRHRAKISFIHSVFFSWTAACMYVCMHAWQSNPKIFQCTCLQQWIPAPALVFYFQISGSHLLFYNAKPSKISPSQIHGLANGKIFNYIDIHLLSLSEPAHEHIHRKSTIAKRFLFLPVCTFVLRSACMQRRGQEKRLKCLRDILIHCANCKR